MTTSWNSDAPPEFALLPNTKELAKDYGLSRYYTNIPCSKGHLAPRLTKTGHCTVCRRENKRNNRKKKRERKDDEIHQTPSTIDYGDQPPGFIPKTHRILHARSRPRIHSKEHLRRIRELYYFDKAEADRVVRFFRHRIVHVKGSAAGQPYELEPWERRILRRLFGWKVRSTGLRKYKTLYLEVPRKNSKTTIVAGLGIFLTAYDKEPGSEVVAAAADREQAGEIFNASLSMIKREDRLAADFVAYQSVIWHPRTNSTLKRISADARTKHGKNLHAILFDELHAQPNAELYDVLHTSTGSRQQALEILITTAGSDQQGICWEMHERAEKVNQGILDDESMLAYIFGADPKDDPFDPHTWFKANPNLGCSKTYDYMARENKRAQQTPRYLNTHLRLDLNLWTDAVGKWISTRVWDKGKAKIDWTTYQGRPCYGGMDLASTQDITAFCLIFPPQTEGEKYAIKPYFWCPEETIKQKTEGENIHYEQWVRAGILEVTKGSRINYDYIRKRIKEESEKYNIKEVSYDRFQAEQLAGQLSEDGLEMFPVAQGIGTMNEPSKEFERLVAEEVVTHDGNALMRFMISNCMVEQNAREEIRPTKKKSKQKIDGVIAAVLAVDRSMRHEEVKPSVYEDPETEVMVL